jgi:hypothetical protein
MRNNSRVPKTSTQVSRRKKRALLKALSTKRFPKAGPQYLTSANHKGKRRKQGRSRASQLSRRLRRLSSVLMRQLRT